MTDPNVTPAPAGTSVYQLIVDVSADLAREGIAKDRSNTQQGYTFRGIDDVYNALAPILSKHRLVILPRILSRTCVERQTKQGSTMFSVTVEAEFDFVSAVDGSHHVVRTYGEAMDSGDKATNKAMSAAYKYAAFQTFCIPTEGDNDADATTPEGVAAPAPQTAEPEPARPHSRVLPHPSVPPRPAPSPQAPVPPVAQPTQARSSGVLIKDVKRGPSSPPDDPKPWQLYNILFEGKVQAADGTMTASAATFDRVMAETAENFRSTGRLVLPAIKPGKKKGSYDLERLDLVVQ